MHKASFAKNTARWSHLATTVESHAEELPHLQPDRQELVEALAAAQEAKHRQLALRAAAAQATRDQEAAMERASQAAARIHSGVVSAYGTKSEMLGKFGLRPWRPRKRRRNQDETLENP